MKKFSIQVSTFFFCVIFLIGTPIIFSNKLISKLSNFNLKNSTKYIIVGNSHPECAFNDSLISNFSNCAIGGESYFYNLIKIKEIIENNAQIETVFLEFDNSQINIGMDEWIWGQKYLLFRYLKYSPFIEQNDLIFLLSHNFKGVLSIQNLILKRNWNLLQAHNYNLMEDKDLGGYLCLIRDKTDSILNNIPKKFDQRKIDIAISESNLKYLEKTIELCKSKNIKLILLRSPIHPQDPDLSNEDKFIEIYTTRFSNVEFIDFKDFPLQNFEYGDLSHLNYKGAKKFSIFFNKLLQNNLLEKERKQAFIDEEIEQLKN